MFSMFRKMLHFALKVVMICCIASGAAYAVPATKPVPQKRSEFSIKPSDVVLPANAKLGQYERATRPFQNGWTLICDYNLVAKRKTCNVTQNITDKSGKIVFSWAMAGTQSGQALMILRSPSSTRGGISVDLHDNKGFPLMTGIEGCTTQVCVGYLPLDNRLKDAIILGSNVTVTFYTANPKKDYDLLLPLKGLSKALDAI